MTENLDARSETARACWAGIVSRLTHCDTAERLKPHLRATFDGPPKAIRSSFISLIDLPCNCCLDHSKFTKCNFYLQQFWAEEGFFSWAFVVGLGKQSRANRQKARLQAFLRSFVNGRWDWTLYFNWAVLEKNNLYKSHALIRWLHLEQKWERQLIYGE